MSVSVKEAKGPSSNQEIFEMRAKGSLEVPLAKCFEAGIPDSLRESAFCHLRDRILAMFEVKDDLQPGGFLSEEINKVVFTLFESSIWGIRTFAKSCSREQCSALSCLSKMTEFILQLKPVTTEDQHALIAQISKFICARVKENPRFLKGQYRHNLDGQVQLRFSNALSFKAERGDSKFKAQAKLGALDVQKIFTRLYTSAY